MNSRRRIREKKRLARRLREWRFAKVAAIIGCDPRMWRGRSLAMARDHRRAFQASAEAAFAALASAGDAFSNDMKALGQAALDSLARKIIQQAFAAIDPAALADAIEEERAKS